MPALPWSVRGSLPPTYACFVTASQQAVRRYRDVPAYLRQLSTLRRQLQDVDGLLGFAVAARLRDRTFWTVIAWVDPDAAASYAKAHGVFAPPQAVSATISWSCLAEELPVGWAEVHRRLRDAGGPAPPRRFLLLTVRGGGEAGG
jgi:hypothetical protein